MEEMMQQQPNNAAEPANMQPAQEQQPGAEAGGVTEQEQTNYKKVVLAGVDALTNEKTYPQIVKMLTDGKDAPADALAQVTITIMLQLDEQSGGKIPEEVILPASEEILTETAQLADSEGIIPLDEAILQEAMEKVVIALGEQYGVSPEEIQALLDQVGQEQAQQIVQSREGAAQQQDAQPQSQQQPGIINQAMGANS